MILNFKPKKWQLIKNVCLEEGMTDILYLNVPAAPS